MTTRRWGHGAAWRGVARRARGVSLFIKVPFPGCVECSTGTGTAVPDCTGFPCCFACRLRGLVTPSFPEFRIACPSREYRYMHAPVPSIIQLVMIQYELGNRTSPPRARARVVVPTALCWTISLGRRLRVTLLLCLSAHPTTSATQHHSSRSCSTCACRRACALLSAIAVRALFASVVFKAAILSTGFEEASHGSQHPVPVASRSAHAT